MPEQAEFFSGIGPKVTDAPLPDLNNTCPNCNTAILDGSPWRTLPDAPTLTRIHTVCPRIQTEEPVAPTYEVAEQISAVMREAAETSARWRQQADSQEPVLSGLGLARAHLVSALNDVEADRLGLAITNLAAGLNEVITHLQHKELSGPTAPARTSRSGGADE